jgi:hypothetical protein
MVSSLGIPRTSRVHGLVLNSPTHAFGTLPLVGSQWLDVDFHSWKFNLELIIALLEQHYNHLKHSCHVVPQHLRETEATSERNSSVLLRDSAISRVVVEEHFMMVIQRTVHPIYHISVLHPGRHDPWPCIVTWGHVVHADTTTVARQIGQPLALQIRQQEHAQSGYDKQHTQDRRCEQSPVAPRITWGIGRRHGAVVRALLSSICAPNPPEALRFVVTNILLNKA